MTADLTAARRWLALSFDTWLLGIDAAMVIFLRLTRLAALDAAALTEARLMVDEKVAAALELQQRALAGSLGKDAQTALRRTLAHYSRAVTANRKRLSR